MDQLEQFIGWLLETVAKAFGLSEEEAASKVLEIALDEEQLSGFALLFLLYPNSDEASQVIKLQIASARRGGILKHYNRVMTRCAPDEEIVFLAKGGKVCPVCARKRKLAKATFGKALNCKK